MHTIVGTFHDTAEAQRAVQDLMAIGFTNDDISLVFSDPEGHYSNQYTGTEVHEHDTGDAAATGAVLGGVEGGLIGVALGLGAFAIPGLGPIIGMGPILAGLIGAGAGAATGGITGALVERGISDVDADYYAEAVRRGYTLVVVDTPEGREDEVMDIMENYDVVDIDERAEHWATEGWTGYDTRSGAYTTDQVTAERDHYLRSRTGATTGVRNYPVRESYRTDVSGYQTSDYNVYASDFRNHYNQYGSMRGGVYTDYEPAYRYGYDLATDRRYANYSWAELEPEARRRWESEYHREGLWEDFKDSVRYAWERVKATVS
jgi:uncharacterized membrane protein